MVTSRIDSPGIDDPVLDQRTLPNGMRLLTAPMPHTRSATISLYVGAGSRYEQPDQAGVSHIVEHLCFKGSEHWPTAQQISEAIEGVGGVLNAGTDRELTVYYAKVPRNHLPLALNLISDMVLRPRFNPAEMEKERNVILEELASVEDNPGQMAEVVLDRLLWPDQALGRDVAGTPESVQNIPLDAAISYRTNQYTPTNTLISVAGAVDADEVQTLAIEATEDWTFGSPSDWERVRPDAGSSRIGLRYKEIEQAHLMVGFPGFSAQDPDRFALSLLMGALGDGMSSRLFVSLREDLGLAYDVHAFSSTLLDTGAAAIYLAVDPDNAMQALEATMAELSRIRAGIPAPELHKILEYTKGRMLLNMEDTRAVSAWYGGQALLLNRTRSVDEVVADLEAVSQEDLVRVADTLIRDECFRLSLVGPFDNDHRFADALHL